MLYRIEGGKESLSLPTFYAIDFLKKLALQLHCSVPVPDFYSNKKSVPIASSFLIWNRMKYDRKNINKKHGKQKPESDNDFFHFYEVYLLRSCKKKKASILLKN